MAGSIAAITPAIIEIPIHNAVCGTDTANTVNPSSASVWIRLHAKIFPNLFLRLHQILKLLILEFLILCIKPQNIKDFFESSSTKIGENVLICSPVAGLEIETINQYVENKIIRIMPNLLIRENNGLIPFVKNYDGDYLNFIDVGLSFLGNTEEFDEVTFCTYNSNIFKFSIIINIIFFCPQY